MHAFVIFMLPFQGTVRVPIASPVRDHKGGADKKGAFSYA
jgi:hypothetical protein